MSQAAAAPTVIDVPALLDDRKIGAFQIRVVMLCAAVVFMDGFDAQAIGYVAPSSRARSKSRPARPYICRFGGSTRPPSPPAGSWHGVEFHCEHPSSPSMPGMDIEKAWQDRYTLAPPSGAGSPPVQWYNWRPLFIGGTRNPDLNHARGFMGQAYWTIFGARHELPITRPVHESRMRSCQSGNGAPGFR